LAVFEADEAKLLVELRNYSQHKFLPYLNPAWQFSQMLPMAEVQLRLHVEPERRVRTYLEQQGDSIDLQPIIVRYTAAVREFYKWVLAEVRRKDEAIEYDVQLHQEGPGQRKRNRAWALFFQQLRQE
jgi:site-specific recombinase XerD